MKRYGFLYQQIYDIENIKLAIKTRRKANETVGALNIYWTIRMNTPDAFA